MTVRTSHGFLRHEVVWFAIGQYDCHRFPAHITYFRQHKLSIPSEFAVTSEPFHTLQLDLGKNSDALFSGFTKTIRNEIRRAERESIRISREQQFSPGISGFIARQRQFNQRKHLGAPMSEKQFQQVDGNWRLYSAHLGESWLADLLLLHDENRIRQWIAISNLDYESRAMAGYASKSLVWQSITDAQRDNFSIYDFGGIVPDENDARFGITAYKRAFGGEEVQESNAVVISNAFWRVGYKALNRLRAA